MNFFSIIKFISLKGKKYSYINSNTQCFQGFYSIVFNCTKYDSLLFYSFVKFHLKIDGGVDGKTHCVKEGQPCRSGQEMSSVQMKFMHETEEGPFTPSNVEICAAAPEDLLIDEDSQDEEDINIT